ncbi:MAG: maleylacetoacetate isomerase [Burkholderiaceae bacterium]
MQLYNYFRSSASFRVRIALNLKELPYDYRPVHLLRSGGEQRTPEFRAMNPDALVPVLIDDTREPPLTLTQSIAIIEYLDETHPEPPLLPREAGERARVRALALGIACDIHPLNNLRVLRYLVKTLGVDEDAKNTWYRHWVESGLQAIEAQLASSTMTGRFCHSDAPTLADVTLIPQIFNGQRVNCDFTAMPIVMRVFGECMKLDAFQRAVPSVQPDAE